MPVTVTPTQYLITPDESNPDSMIPMSTGLSKGDILVYRGEGNVVRLPVGNDGQVLTVDSSTETGLKWA